MNFAVFLKLSKSMFSMHCSAPGKLMLAGEWSVLENSKCIVLSINKRVHAQIEEADEISIKIDDFNIDAKARFDGKQLVFDNISDDERQKLVFIKASIEATLLYLGKYKPFRIRTWGEESQITVDGVAKKIGFGSSAASVVATVGALLAFNGVKMEKEVVYKLSTIAHYFAQGKLGSAFDVAASTYGGATIYKRFDADWLTKKMEAGEKITDIVKEKWPGFFAQNLQLPEDFILSIGWTKESASTSAMVKQMNSFKQASATEYKRIYDSIALLVDDLIVAWKQGDNDEMLHLLRENETILSDLGKKSGVNIETPELKTLSDLANECGAAGKLSGAGGGDCGIAVCFDKATAEKVRKAWQEAGLYIVDADIDKDGVRIE